MSDLVIGNLRISSHHETQQHHPDEDENDVEEGPDVKDSGVVAENARKEDPGSAEYYDEKAGGSNGDD